MNDASSRSHAIFTIIVEQHLRRAPGPGEREYTSAKFHLVDLVRQPPPPYPRSLEISIPRAASLVARIARACRARLPYQIPLGDVKRGKGWKAGEGKRIVAFVCVFLVCF